MPIPLLLAPIISMLVDKGLDLAASAIDGGAEKAKDYIEEKTGIELGKNELSEKDVAKIKAMQDNPETKIKLQELALQKIKEENRHNEELADDINEKYSIAHNSYHKHSEATDKLSFQIMRENLIIIGILVIIEFGAIYFLRDNGGLVATISGLIGAIINSLLAERQAVSNFRFGSSIGSKIKNDIIKK